MVKREDGNGEEASPERLVCYDDATEEDVEELSGGGDAEEPWLDGGEGGGVVVFGDEAGGVYGEGESNGDLKGGEGEKAVEGLDGEEGRDDEDGGGKGEEIVFVGFGFGRGRGGSWFRLLLWRWSGGRPRWL